MSAPPRDTASAGSRDWRSLAAAAAESHEADAEKTVKTAEKLRTMLKIMGPGRTYEFGRDDQPVPLTPRCFDTLRRSYIVRGASWKRTS
jgi:hypothetical protein